MQCEVCNKELKATTASCLDGVVTITYECEECKQITYKESYND